MTETAKPFSAKERRVMAAMVAAVFTITLACLLMPYVDAENGGYDGELTLYGYNVTMGLQNPSQVETVEWDFGDGSATETVEITTDNPLGTVTHRYAEKGDYTVTATMRNSYDGGSETVLTYMYHIMGYPVITFDSQGGSSVQSIEGTRSSYVADEPASPTRDGYDFTGWYTDADCTAAYDWSSTVSSHMTLYAGWSSNAVTYTVTFDVNGGDAAIESQSVTSGDRATEPASPTRDGFVFMGWQCNGSLWNFTSPVYSDMTLVAVWEEDVPEIVRHTVTFDANGGTAGYSQLIVTDGHSLELPDASRDGYAFDGWYDGDNLVGLAGDSYTVSSSVTLTAHWTAVTPDDGDDGDLWMMLAIVFAIIAAVCLVAAYFWCLYAIAGTVISIAAAIVCWLINGGMIL